MLFEERDHARSGFKEGVDHCRVIAITQFVFQVSARLSQRLRRCRPVGPGDCTVPTPSPGPGGGATKNRVLFHHYHFQAMPSGRYGCCQTGRTGADNQHIASMSGEQVRLGRHGLKLRCGLFWNLVPENI